MDRMNRIVSILSSLAVMFLAIVMAVSFCRWQGAGGERRVAPRAAPSSPAPLLPSPWMHDCERENECIA